jgi:hypothetical protein
VLTALAALTVLILCSPLLACSGGSAAKNPAAPSSSAGPGGPNANGAAATSLTVGPCPTTTMLPGTTAQLSAQATLADSTSKDVTTQSKWFSTNRNAATVDEKGTVTAAKPGLTMVNAQYQGIQSACQFLVDITPPPPPLSSSGGGIVISEFRPRGPNGENDEFIELRNDATEPISVGGWQVGQAPRSGITTKILVTLSASVIIKPGCYLLLTRSAKEQIYSGIPGDVSFIAPLLDDSGIAVLRPGGTVVDAVGMSLGTLYKEGVPLLSFGSNNADRSYQRIAGDSDNNMTDFALRSPSTPTNRAGGCG